LTHRGETFFKPSKIKEKTGAGKTGVAKTVTIPVRQKGPTGKHGWPGNDRMGVRAKTRQR